jgi:hypothetical protein
MHALTMQQDHNRYPTFSPNDHETISSQVVTTGYNNHGRKVDFLINHSDGQSSQPLQIRSELTNQNHSKPIPEQPSDKGYYSLDLRQAP